MRILVDTNVFLDFLLERENFQIVSDFFTLSNKFRNTIYVTSISVRDIGYVVHKVFHSEEKAREMQHQVYSLCTKIIDITGDDTINSIFDAQNDFEDSLIKEAAEREMVDLIVTYNVKDFRKLGFPALTPKEINDIFIQQLKFAA